MKSVEELNDEYWELQKKIIDKFNEIRPISLENIILNKCATILVYYPFSDKKLKIFNKLNKKQKVGMLNRHLLSVANKLDINKPLIDGVSSCIRNNRRYKKYQNDGYWNDLYNKNQDHFIRLYNIFINCLLDEINRRKNIKYLRNKKLEKILDK
jgi:hypothetical protein